MEFLLAVTIVTLIAMLVFVAHLSMRIVRLERRLAELGEARTVIATPPPAAAVGSAPKPAPPTRDTANPFESLVGGRLLVWVGGVALIVAAVFLIRFSIEIGLITPELRMIAAGLFGLALLGGGEWARTGSLADDPRISQALVGAGLAVFYAAVYASYILYGFLGPTAASALMLLVTASAFALSSRHGLPTAVMGLVGGYLTPLLVGNAKAGAMPLLAYLALLDAAVVTIARRRGWPWMAAAAVLASYAWATSLILGSAPDAMAAGVFVLLVAILAGAAAGEEARSTAMLPLVLAAPSLAALAFRSDVAAWGWILFALLGAAAVVIGRWRPAQRWSPVGVLATGLLLLVVKASLDDDPLLASAAVGMALLFGGGGVALALQQRRQAWRVLACLGCGGPVLVLRLAEDGWVARPGWGLLFGLAAAGPGLLAVTDSRHAEAEWRGGPPALAFTALLAFALHDLIAWNYLSIGWLAASIALIAAGVRLPNRPLRVGGLILLTLTVLKAFLIDAQALTGLLRILSFLGLGAALIVIGRYYGAVLNAEAGAPDGKAGAEA